MVQRPMTPDEIRDALSGAGESRHYGLTEADAAMRVISDLVRQARGVLTPTEMANLAGISRETIYQIMKSKSDDER